MASSVWNRHRGRVTHCVEGSPLPAHPIALLWLARVGYHSSVVRRAGRCHTRSMRAKRMRAKSRKTAGQCAWRLELIGHLRLPCHPVGEQAPGHPTGPVRVRRPPRERGRHREQQDRHDPCRTHELIERRLLTLQKKLALFSWTEFLAESRAAAGSPKPAATSLFEWAFSLEQEREEKPCVSPRPAFRLAGAAAWRAGASPCFCRASNLDSARPRSGIRAPARRVRPPDAVAPPAARPWRRRTCVPTGVGSPQPVPT